MENEHISEGSNWYENIKTFECLSSLLTNKTSIYEEVYYRPNARNSCYYSVHTLMSSRLLTRNFKIKIRKTTTLPVVLHGCET